ncbi:MAG: UPF0149 family protein [Dokdonella sp.]|nr:MAG: YecA family protein [Gammaproteobacteria bacterium]TXI74544.1 MAG: UPF0149 family protein [Dokdonella sp.]
MTHNELSDTLIRLRLSVSASDLHGSLTGLLCGGGKAQAGNWLAALELDADPGDAGNDPILRQFHRECREQLDDSELGFAPLLPDDETSIAERSEALAEWCRGFLGGFGLAGVGESPALQADAREIMADFSAIAGSDFSQADNEEDEEALNEIIEFVRVSVLLLYAEHGGPATPAHATAGTSRRVH